MHWLAAGAIALCAKRKLHWLAAGAMALSKGRIQGLVRTPEMNGKEVDVMALVQDSEGCMRYEGSADRGTRLVRLKKENVIFDIHTEMHMSYRVSGWEIMQRFGAARETSVSNLCFRDYHRPPTIEEVFAFWGPRVYTEQMECLRRDFAASKKGLWDFVDASNSQLLAFPGLVFSTGEKGDQTAVLQPQVKPMGLWWPCLVPKTEGHVIPVRCWEQNLRGSRPWYTPRERVHFFDFAVPQRKGTGSDNLEEIVNKTTVTIEELHSDGDEEWTVED